MLAIWSRRDCMDKKIEKKAVLICFNIQSDKFKSNYERNKFFRGLYGWKQMIKKERNADKRRYGSLIKKGGHHDKKVF